MRKSLISSLMCVAVIVTSALGDTIHLKNGSVLKGKVTSFADDQFIVMLDTGSGRYLSKAMVYMGDVARIEFDTAQAASADTGSTTTPQADQPARADLAPGPFLQGHQRVDGRRPQALLELQLAIGRGG